MGEREDHMFTVQQAEEAIGIPFAKWSRRCHNISLRIVRSSLIPGPRRVARGTCKGVLGQHSWIVAGSDCYAKDARIIDPTLWSYDASVGGIWFGGARDGRHVPHGAGSIWESGRPDFPEGEPIWLTVPDSDLPEEARVFLEILGPLDRHGWMQLASSCPVEGWPAGEILAAMYNTPELRAAVPIDRIGMLTGINPGGLYLPGPDWNEES